METVGTHVNHFVPRTNHNMHFQQPQTMGMASGWTQIQHCTFGSEGLLEHKAIPPTASLARVFLLLTLSPLFLTEVVVACLIVVCSISRLMMSLMDPC